MSYFSLLFLGTGNACATELGNSSCVLERDGEPLLLIDCGPDTLRRFDEHHPDHLPQAIFVTHTHMDHVGGLEGLFYQAWFARERPKPIRLYVPVDIVPLLHDRVGRHPGVLAEGGANFWDCFQLIPVDETFWHRGLRFTVFPVRHHEFRSAFGVALPGRFLYTGDTRPIPEIVNRYASHGEPIFHDCALRGSPSHTGVDDLAREYAPGQRRRLVLYHYESTAAGDELERRGYTVARPGSRLALDKPEPGPQSGAPSAIKLAR